MENTTRKNEPIEKLAMVSELMLFCFQEQEKGNDFFFTYHGHIDCFEIHGYVGKWNRGKERIANYTFNLSDLTFDKVLKAISCFKDELENSDEHIDCKSIVDAIAVMNP